MMSYEQLAQAYAQACRVRDMALAQLEDIGAGYAEKMDEFVRVVRCKDCKWRGDECKDGEYYFCVLNLHRVQAEQFCSGGERRDNG